MRRQLLGGWSIWGGLQRLTVLLLLITASPVGTFAAEPINPCNFTNIDGPCRISDGEYRLLVPAGPGPFPAIVYLTGSLGLSRTVTEAAYFREMVVREGYALIVPTALDITYSDGQVGTGWGRRIRAAVHPRNDIDFLRRVLDTVALNYNIDLERLVWTGQSDGGFMIYEIACHHPEMGVAFAVHGAGYAQRLPQGCKRPVRFMHAHGVEDDIVPFSGRLVTGPILQSNDLMETLAMMARSNGCKTAPQAARPYFGFERTRWGACGDGGALDLLVHQGGHGWPPEWMPAVLDWVDETTWQPAVSRTVRVGDDGGESGPVMRQSAPSGRAGGRFLSSDRASGNGSARFLKVPK